MPQDSVVRTPSHVDVGGANRRRTVLGLLLAYATLAIGGVYSVGTVLGSTLFLSRLPASTIPMLLVLPAAGVLVVYAAYAELSRHVEGHRLAFSALWVLVGMTVGLRIALAETGGEGLGILGALFLLTFVAGRLAMTQFWTFVGWHLDPREERRYVGRIAIGGMAAMVVSGLAVDALVRVIAPPDALWLFIACLVGCAIVARRLRELAPTPVPIRGRRTGARTRGFYQGDAGPEGGRLFSVLLGFAVLASLLLNVAAVRFYVGMHDAFGADAVAMAVFYGRYTVVAGLAAIALQIFTPWSLRRLGLASTLLALPLGLLLATLGTLVSGGSVVGAAAMQGTDRALRRTTADGALSLLFQPLHPDVQAMARARFEFAYAGAMAVVGIVLALLWERLPPTWWVWTICAAAVAWMILTAAVRPLYVAALGRRVDDAGRLGVLTQTPPAELDRSLVQALRVALSDPDPLRAAHALGVLRTVDFARWGKDVTRLLRHPDADLRRAGLGLAQDHHAHDAAPEVLRLCVDDDPDVRAAALAAAAHLAPDDAPDALRRALDDGDPEVRRAAAAGLLARGDLDDLLAIGPQLQALLQSRDPAERAEAMRTLGRAGMGTSFRTVVRGLADPEPRVREAALEAAGRLAMPQTAPALVNALGDPESRGAALAALEAIGPGARPAFEAALRDRSLARPARLALPVAIGIVLGASGASLLERLFDAEDDDLRGAALRAFAALGCPPEMAPGTVQARLDTEVRLAVRAAMAAEAGERSGAGPLLREALALRAFAAEARVVRVLALRDPALRTETSDDAEGPLVLRDRRDPFARDTLVPLDPRRLEMLDVGLEGRERSDLLPLFESDHARVATFAAARFGWAFPTLRDVLEDALASHDPWLRVCALHEVGERRDLAFEAEARRALAHDDATVRETALRACARMLRTSDARPLLHDRAQHDASARVRSYARAWLDGAAA